MNIVVFIIVILLVCYIVERFQGLNTPLGLLLVLIILVLLGFGGRGYFFPY
jgi:hypothetical protein